ncbi:unnamed protein product [Phytophthora fragariaefolia]|uniref:Unnamed protein product n=1 Tax=Phytophthora fragariaefolia TaxID=1490495 RepID=A0A9W7CHX0_9STRA|nr:unnamed protein product [Phytophthora fragariaefolia]
MFMLKLNIQGRARVESIGDGEMAFSMTSEHAAHNSCRPFWPIDNLIASSRSPRLGTPRIATFTSELFLGYVFSKLQQYNVGASTKASSGMLIQHNELIFEKDSSTYRKQYAA